MYITEKYEGRWDWKNFSKEELMCKCGCGKMKICVTSLNRLQILRDTINKPMQVTSAYRCPEYNSIVSSTGLTGPHTTGRAFDIGVFGGRASTIVSLADPAGFHRVGVNQKGEQSYRFIHLDDIPSLPSWIWSY